LRQNPCAIRTGNAAADLEDTNTVESWFLRHVVTRLPIWNECG
jgi:hypothetical protein